MYAENCMAKCVYPNTVVQN